MDRRFCSTRPRSKNRGTMNAIKIVNEIRQWMNGIYLLKTFNITISIKSMKTVNAMSVVEAINVWNENKW